MRVHGHLRFANDPDVLVDRDPANMQVVAHVFSKIGARGEEIDRVGVRPRQRIFWQHLDGGLEVFTSLDGIDSEKALASRIGYPDEELQVTVICRDLLMKAKRLASNDPERGANAQVDRDDLDTLGQF